MSTPHASEISALSLSLLHLMREIARKDPSEASVYFGVTEEIARLVAECTVDDLHAIAAPGVMLFVPRIKTAQLRQFIQQKGLPLEQARTVAMALAR